MPRGVYDRSKSVREALRVMASTANLKHGATKNGKLSPEYISYRGAKQRCVDPNTKGWKNYGGRGITMCPHWMDSFLKFREDMGPRPKGFSIERINNDKGYLCAECCPPQGNCCWASMGDQIKNQRHMFFHEERSKRRREWFMNQTPEYRRLRAVAAARARWGG